MYNSLFKLPSIPYQIIKHLALSNEIIWKLLKYNSYDALSKPNLSFDEKMKMVWKTGPQEKFNVFLTPLIEDAITESKTIMKVYSYYIKPDSPYLSNVVYAFDFLYGGKMTLVEYDGIPVSRGDLLINQVLDTLNGIDIGGIGKFIFYDELSRYSIGKVVIGNSKTFTGKCLYMTVQVGDGGKEGLCGC